MAPLYFNQGGLVQATFNAEKSNDELRYFNVKGHQRDTVLLKIKGGTNEVDEVALHRSEHFYQFGMPSLYRTNPGRFDALISNIMTKQEPWNKALENYDRVQQLGDLLTQNPAHDVTKVLTARTQGRIGRTRFETQVIKKDLNIAANFSGSVDINATWFDSKSADAQEALNMMLTQVGAYQDEFTRLRREGRLSTPAQGLLPEEKLYLIGIAFNVAIKGYALALIS